MHRARLGEDLRPPRHAARASRRVLRGAEGGRISTRRPLQAVEPRLSDGKASTAFCLKHLSVISLHFLPALGRTYPHCSDAFISPHSHCLPSSKLARKAEGILRPANVYHMYNFKEYEVEAVVYPSASTSLPNTRIRALLFGPRHPPESLPPYIYPSALHMRPLIAAARIAKLDPAVVEHLESMPVARALSPRMLGLSRYHFLCSFLIYGFGNPPPGARRWYWPSLLQLFSRREAAMARGEKLGSFLWTCVMVAFMLPFGCLGFCLASFADILERRRLARQTRGGISE